MLPQLKKKTLLSLKKAHSLIATMIEMVEKDRYCIDIMHQNLAVLGLLKSAQQTFMENHLKTCFKKALSTKNKATEEQMIKEILKVTKWRDK
ncbi:MAG: hypothetical protein A2754_01395 [Candidatus Magasanikbacteria bacterium RIFCSPHIGHO2_01_FULL_47_8]|uniref:Transcriptional regulator n=1 Tax=Candidatus Magasanikbacteria bacterium RIFCSPHIGHO2_01_FULL_47_8 TaxID=1798673 RepID=A0A1F6MCY1_9BACT|nr:MAG: hypothetical protein A2754_01395 [Candidatus Magasanikbacteria bacterium RIFCSPHIGHO2_01_FULL_47_8]